MSNAAQLLVQPKVEEEDKEEEKDPEEEISDELDEKITQLDARKKKKLRKVLFLFARLPVRTL